jgi:DNA-binding transcriptional MerR regulator
VGTRSATEANPWQATRWKTTSWSNRNVYPPEITVTVNYVTIEQLATRVGLSTRNIREYQALGLLERPERIGRVGRYGPEHLRRLRLVARMQARGWSLAAIADALGALAAGQTLADLLGLAERPASGASADGAVAAAESLLAAIDVERFGVLDLVPSGLLLMPGRN